MIGYLWGAGPYGAIIALVVAGVLSVVSYFNGDKLVLASTRAKAVTPQDEPRLHNVVEGLAIAAGIPKPRVYVVPEQAPNAFATGRDPEHSSIAVTQGLLASLNRVELEGVIGHELAHVLDRDILVGTVVATVVGAAVLLSEFFMRSWFWGGVGGRRDSDSGGGGGVVGLVLLVVGLLLLLVAPIAGQIIRLSVSRNREYLADAQGVMLTRYPPGLDRGAREDRGLADGDALGEQCHGAPVAEPALTDRGGADGLARAPVQHPPADRGSDPAPAGDVTQVARGSQDRSCRWRR